MQEIEGRYEEGQTTREALSINEIPRDVVMSLNDHFISKGILAAVMGARREPAMVTGFALELSVPNADWWQTDYSDVGLKTGRCAYFHNDESRDVYKAMLYLTDVESEENGPTSFIPSSFGHQENLVQWLFDRAIDCAGRHCRELYSDRHGARWQSSKVWRRHTMILPPVLIGNSHFGFDVVDDAAR